MDSYRITDLKTIRLEKTLLFAWFVLNLIIGVLTVHEYGMSIDETNNYRYAADTLAAYPSFFGTRYQPHYDSSYEGHGPAFITIAGLAVRAIQSLWPDIFIVDLWHFSYFVTFQLAGLCLYWLTRRWFSVWTAWGVLVLFITQPLLRGHAFINPKDIPFMFLVTLSILLGFRLVDSRQAAESFVSLERPVNLWINQFRAAAQPRKKRFLTALTLFAAITLALVLFSRPINAGIEQIITFFYTAQPDSWAGQIFNSVASHASNLTVDDYVTKALRVFHRLEYGALTVAVIFFLLYFALVINNTTLATFLNERWEGRHTLGETSKIKAKELQSSLRLSALKSAVREVFQALGHPHVILAGVALGLATAVRAIAPFAGVIVVFALWAKVRSRAWTTAIAYFLIAGVVTYLAWPRLWGAPIQRYLEGLGIVSNFPFHPGQVLFRGQLYSSRDLPLSYVPTLLNIQFTEPLLVSLYIGFGILCWKLLRAKLPTDLLLYIGLGFAFPLLGLMLLNSALYNNFRQALFLIPAMFLLAAFTLELLFSKLNPVWARVLLIVLLALPGVYASVKLYPYEYVYYNSFVGGPAGARNRYELDYWRISLRQVALEMNQLAPTGSKILVTRSAGLFARYARPDLIVDKPIDSILDPSEGFDFVVQVDRREAWDQYPESKIVVSIERAGAVLATAKDIRTSEK